MGLVSLTNFLVMTTTCLLIWQSEAHVKDGEKMSLEAMGVAAISNNFGNKALVMEAKGRNKREVGHVEKEEEIEGEGIHRKKKKYRRLAHAVRIQGDIRSRYATTLVSSEVNNPESTSREVYFSVVLPDTAFISRFAMEIDKELFIAEVKEKEEAWRTYTAALKEGKTAGHVGVSARHSNRFRVSVNIERHNTVKFYLLYEELLQRRNSQYTYLVNINSHHKFSKFSVDLNIQESKNLTYVRVPGLRRHEIVPSEDTNLPGAQVLLNPLNPGHATVGYSPSLTQLHHQLSKSSMQFVVEYEVDHSVAGGDVELMDGYFVHFVAPEHLPPMAKHVVFVLDTSGSMRVRKMEQTILAMKTILGELRSQDYITIIDFNSKVQVWEAEESSMVSANQENINKAMAHVSGLKAAGETNINDALIKALTICSHVQQKLKDVQTMILFLTDGHPTVGVRDTMEILQNVRDANKETETAIFSLAFGRKTDFGMLKTLSLQNNGFARKIYSASDASLQLSGFYKEVSSPILNNVQFNYKESTILGLTQTDFHTFYQGGEMVVAGMISDQGEMEPVIEYEISAHQAIGRYEISGQFSPSLVPVPASETVDTYIDVIPDVLPKTSFMERLWAYLTIKNLLTKVARGELMSCSRAARSTRYLGDYEGSSQDDIEDYTDLQDLEDDEEIERLLNALESDILICNNLERALYLSLHYQFVTPLTSLVVVKPDHRENGDFGQADKFGQMRLHSEATKNSGIINSFVAASVVIIHHTMRARG